MKREMTLEKAKEKARGKMNEKSARDQENP
jgi:hypothetical protein